MVFRILIFAAAVLAALVLYFVLWLLFFSGPTLHLVVADGGVAVSWVFLGEYCQGASKVEICGLPDHEPIWTLVPSGERDSRLCGFRLSPGPNPVLPPDVDDLQVLTPADSDTFQLEVGATYVLEVCGNNGFGRDGCTRRRFSLGAE